MKRLKFLMLLVTIICIGASGLFARSVRHADKETFAYLKQFRTDYTTSMLDKNPELLQSYYADRIRLMPEFQKTVIGKEHVLTYHKAFAGRFDVQTYTREPLEVFDLGFQVLETGTFTLKMKRISTGREHELQGKYQNIWEKQENTRPILIMEAWNYMHQVSIAEELQFEDVPVVHVALQAHVPINSYISFELAALNTLQELTLAQHDHKIWSQFFADDAMLIYSNHPIYQGREALDSFLEMHVKELPVFEKLDIRNDHIDELGQFVVEYASHVAITRNGEYSGITTGKDIRIWRREPNGSLKIFRQMAMYD